MAIAFDAYTNGGNQSAGPALTFAHTVTGANTILHVGVTDNTTNHVPGTGVTYNGVQMTEIASSPIQIPGNRFIHLFELVAPTSGTHNVVITADQTQFLEGYAISHTGAKQSAQPDANGTTTTSAAAGPVSKTLTTVADNSWLIAFARTDGATTFSAGTNTTLRSAGGDSAAFGDTNAAETPPGNFSISIAYTGTNSSALIAVSIAPAVGVAASSGYAFVM